MFIFDELVLIKKVIDFAIDNGYKEDLNPDTIAKINVIERKLIAFEVPKSNKGSHE
jgi:hypothetical protein